MNHIHKYIRVKKSDRAIKTFFKCAFDGCTHKIAKEFAIGRYSICNRCNEQFVLDARALDLAKPHCARCTRSEKNENVSTLIEKMNL